MTKVTGRASRGRRSCWKTSKDTAGHLRGEDTSIRQRDWQPVSEQIDSERENASLSGKGNAFITEREREMLWTLLLSTSALFFSNLPFHKYKWNATQINARQNCSVQTYTCLQSKCTETDAAKNDKLVHYKSS